MRSIKDTIGYGLRKANYKDVRGHQQQVIEAYCRLSLLLGDRNQCKAGGGGGGREGTAWGGDLTFFKN